MPACFVIIKFLSVISDKDPFAFTNYNMPAIRAHKYVEINDKNHEINSIHSLNILVPLLSR